MAHAEDNLERVFYLWQGSEAEVANSLCVFRPEESGNSVRKTDKVKGKPPFPFYCFGFGQN